MIAYYISSKSLTGAVVMVGSVAAVFQYLDILMSAFGFYTGDYENVIHWWQDYNAAAIIFETDVCSPASISTHPKTTPDKWQSIKVSDFSFTYGIGQASLHCGLMELERGKRIAFVGESGAGKSTCLNVLRGLLPVDGKVTIDEDMHFPISALGDIATLVSQEAEIFENTIQYNITLGLPAMAKEIESAACVACFDEVAMNLPSGYDTDIRENGVNLSGGEKQRLCGIL